MIQERSVTELPPLMAELLRDDTHHDIWNAVRKGPEERVAMTFTTNTLGFEYDPAGDQFAVYVTYASPSDAGAEVKLKTADLQKGLAKHTRGAP